MDGTGLAVLLLPAAFLFVPVIWKAIVNNYKLRSIPTVGCSGLLTSYIGALRFNRHAHEFVKEGYSKYRGSVFKVPMMTKWMVIVSGPQMIEDIRTAGEDYLSIQEAFKETFHADITMGSEVSESSLTARVVKLPLTRNIGAKFDDVRDEIVAAFNDNITIEGNDWVSVTAYPTIMEIVCRASNRMLVGLPLCRDPDYLDLNKTFTVNIANAVRTINRFPFFLRSFVGRLNKDIPRDIKRGKKHLSPLFKERIEQQARHGQDWSENPNDVVSWFLSYSPKDKIDPELLSTRVLGINFAAIHTTTMSFTYVLFELATRAEYVQPMRDEVEAAIREEGWSKEAMSKLRKVDSFIRETLRMSGIGAVGVQRKVMKDFTFSNGVTVPAGNLMAVPLTATHTDPDNYTNPETFDGFRFEKMRNDENIDHRHQIVTVDTNHILFGQGRRACPGRFFVANEMKAMLAHVLLNYDVKMVGTQGRPKNWTSGFSSLPDPTAKVMFRKRMSV